MIAVKNLTFYIFLIVLNFNFVSYSQTKHTGLRISFNSISDTLIILTKNSSTYEVVTNADSGTKTIIYHIRGNRLLSSYISTSKKWTSVYSTKPLTNDRMLIQIIKPENDSVLFTKNFYIINKYLDDIKKAQLDSLNDCNNSLLPPYKFTFNVYVNDKKINDYNVKFLKEIITTENGKGYFQTRYSDSLKCIRENDDFYISEQYDSLGILIKIGKRGSFFFHIKHCDFKYGAQIYFSVSTNDKKLYREYKNLINKRELSELREKPYLTISKNYLDKFKTSNKHSILFINCNPICNPTWIYEFHSEYYRIKDLR